MKNKRLIALRKARQLTQGEVGEAISVSKQHVCRMENNQSTGIKTLKKLAGFFGVTIDYLLEDDEIAKTTP